MDPDPTTPCPECQAPISPAARRCPLCRSRVLVDLRLEGAVRDPRARYRLARVLLALGEGVPALTTLQDRLLESGGVVLSGVTLDLAQRAAKLLQAEGLETRVRAAAGGPRPRVVLFVGLAAALLLAVAAFRALRSPAARGPAESVLTPDQITSRSTAATVALRCPDSVGSGFFVEQDRLLTNAHVLCPGKPSIRVRFSDGRDVEGTVEWSDEALDLAVVRAPGLQAQPLPMGDVADLKIGDSLTMIGIPVGMAFTVHKASVSHLERSELGVAYFQIDARVNPGNSGGPLIDARGRVVGVVTLKKKDAEGIGFALPINYVYTGETAMMPDSSRPPSTHFARMKEQAQSDSERLAGELAQIGQRPALMDARLFGWSIRAYIAMPSNGEPIAQSFSFSLWSGGERVCTLDGAVDGWKKMENRRGEGTLSPRAKGWLGQHGFSSDLYIGYTFIRWYPDCTREPLNPPVDLELEGADPAANRVRFE